MKSTKIFFLMILAVMIAFSSCKKEELSEVIKMEEEVDPEISTNNPIIKRVASTNSASSEEGLDLGCFSIEFPFDLVVDGANMTINTEEDFNDAVESATQSVDFAYPLDITYPDGETDVVNDGIELGEAFASCVPTGGWGNDGFPAFLICDINSCYQLVYPVDLIDPDGNTYTANSEDEFIDLIVNYPELYFVLPISLTDVDGETVVANSEDDLYALLADCDDIYNPGDSTLVGEGFACYELVFPFDVVNTAGENVTVNNYDEFYFLMFNGDLVNFAYPLSLLAEDGTTTTVNNDEELYDALEACGDITVIEGLDFFSLVLGSSVFGGDCYDLVYPFNVTGTDGTVITIADQAAAEDLLNNGTDFYIVELPVSVIVISTGETVVINSMEDYADIAANCGGCPPGNELDALFVVIASSITGNDCYDLVYPFSVVDETGAVMDIADATAAEALLNGGPHYLMQMPFDINLIATGETVSITDVGVFFDVISDCD